MNRDLPDAPRVAQLAAFDELRIGHCASLLVLVWRGKVTEQSLARLGEVEAAFVEHHHPISVLNVVTDDATGEASVDLIRSAAAAANRFDEEIRGSAVVLLSSGYVAAATRATLDGLLILVGKAERYRLFANVDLALEWLWKLPLQDPRILDPRLGDAVRTFVRESRTDG